MRPAHQEFARAALVAVLADGPLGAEVAEGDVGLAAGRQGRPLDAERGGAAGHPLDQQAEVDHAGQDQLGVERGEGGLQPGHPHRRLLEGDLLFLGCVGGVVGGDALDRAVAQALDQRLAVGLGAQRRVHLEAPRVEAADLLVGEAEVVRARLALICTPAALAARTASTDSTAERCWTWIRPPS